MEGNSLNQAFLPYTSLLPDVAHRSLGRSLEHNACVWTAALAISKKTPEQRMLQAGTALTNPGAGEAAGDGLCSSSAAVPGQLGCPKSPQTVTRSFARD